MKVVLELSGCFTALEQKIYKNTEVIINVCGQLKVVEIHVQKNENVIKDISEQIVKIQQGIDDGSALQQMMEPTAVRQEGNTCGKHQSRGNGCACIRG